MEILNSVPEPCGAGQSVIRASLFGLGAGSLPGLLVGSVGCIFASFFGLELRISIVCCKETIEQTTLLCIQRQDGSRKGRFGYDVDGARVRYVNM